MEITLIFSSSLLIQSGKHKILLDSIIEDRNLIAPMPQKIEDEVIRNEGIFKCPNYILFTHDHGDHFSLSKCIEYMKKNDCSNIKIVLPDEVYDGMHIGDRELEIDYYQSEHIEIPIPCNNHFCMTIRNEERNVLLLSDAKMDYEWFEGRFFGVKFDAVFCNPVAISNRVGRKILKMLNPKKTYIYHIPPEANDVYKYFIIAETNIQRYADELPECKVIRHPMMKITV